MQTNNTPHSSCCRRMHLQRPAIQLRSWIVASRTVRCSRRLYSSCTTGRDYVLTYSSNCYNTDLYGIAYATALSVSGPYTKASSPLLVTGDDSLTGPGGATPTPDGTFMVFHATVNFNPLTRYMCMATISWNGTAMNV
ncbi:hypothetical protein EDC04DRAFT_2628898 [Pisolithus marmoratus]|nr:hypothetical protein EDC04DRAFT_2628898 [Pisolithus marmoratus]